MRLEDILTREPVEPNWIVKDLIPRGQIMVWAGAAGAGKSVVCYHLAYAVAAGLHFLNLFPTVSSKVLYFDEENSQPDFHLYNQRVWGGLGFPPIEQLSPMLRIEHFALLKGWKFPMTTALTEHKPGLVIIDTATSAFHIQDENDNAEANRILTDLRRIRIDSKCQDTTFIILKHEKQRDDPTQRRTIRGAKLWLGAVDQVLYHVVAPGAKWRKDRIRLTRLEPDKPRGFGLTFPVAIDPSFTDSHPKGLKFQGEILYPGD